MDPRLQGKLEKVHNTGKEGIFEKTPEETYKEDFLGEEKPIFENFNHTFLGYCPLKQSRPIDSHGQEDEARYTVQNIKHLVLDITL